MDWDAVQAAFARLLSTQGRDALSVDQREALQQALSKVPRRGLISPDGFAPLDSVFAALTRRQRWILLGK